MTTLQVAMPPEAVCQAICSRDEFRTLDTVNFNNNGPLHVRHEFN